MLGQSMGPKVDYGSMQGVEGSILGMYLRVGSYLWGWTILPINTDCIARSAEVTRLPLINIYKHIQRYASDRTMFGRQLTLNGQPLIRLVGISRWVPDSYSACSYTTSVNF